MKKEFNIYFFNGFSKPELVANSIDELLADVKIVDNYLGDVTEDLIDDLRYVNLDDLEDLNNLLYDYAMVANPTLEVLMDEFMSRWFENNRQYPYELLEDFGSRQDIYSILNRQYDDFKMYPEYKESFIIEDSHRFKYGSSVIGSFDTLEDAEHFMNEEDLWELSTLLCIDKNGRAYYPSF